MISTFENLDPITAIGNIGYTKNKIPENRNVEPIRIKSKTDSKYELVLTMDGYLLQEEDIKSEIESDYSFETGNKTEVIGALLHQYITEQGISFEAGKKLVDKLHGRATFALTALINDGKETHMLSLNDDRAFEPFCYGIIDNAFVVSSESFSLRQLGGFMKREFDGAEMTICSSKGIETKRLREEILLPDIFQGVYFGHPSSLFRGKEIYQIRKEIGRKLVNHYGIPNTNRIIPNPESGWGVTMGIFEGIHDKLEEKALDYSRLDEGIIMVKDRKALDQFRELKTVYPGIVKNPQAVRTFQELIEEIRDIKVRFKFGGIDSLLKGMNLIMGDDSIVRGSVSDSLQIIYDAAARYLEFWISYAPMFFPSFKLWHDGRKCLDELAVQKAFKGDNPYNKTHEEINEAVAKMIGVNKVRYNRKETVEKVMGPGSFQALDASYPISEEFWPDFIKEEVEKFKRYN